MIPQLLTTPWAALLPSLTTGTDDPAPEPEPTPSPSPAEDPSTGDIVLEQTVSVLAVAVGLVVAFVLALVVAEVIGAVVRAARRRSTTAQHLSRRSRRPLRVTLTVALSWLAIRVVLPDGDAAPGWRPPLEHLFLVALIVAVAWLVASLAFVMEDAAISRYRVDIPDNRHARRVRTQMMLLRRLTVVVIAVCAIAGILLTFEGARAAGAGILASAGLLSVVAGLAAQTSLANVFAGLQLAFTDAIRVDDVVVVEGEWGRIEEITMTYVVVHLWDDRRLIMPSTYFTQTPFQNWTRRQADLLGTVELDLDWRVPVAAMRAELARLLHASALWDERVGVLQVTEATGGTVRVRALASAADAPSLFDLRCHLREGLVGWLQREHPGALPRTRWEQSVPDTAAADGADGADGADARAAGDDVAAGPADGGADVPAPADADLPPQVERAVLGAEPAVTDDVGSGWPEDGRRSGAPDDAPGPNDTVVLRLDGTDGADGADRADGGPARSRRSVRASSVVPVDGETAQPDDGETTTSSATPEPGDAPLGTGTLATDAPTAGSVRRRSAAQFRADRGHAGAEPPELESNASLFTGSVWAVERSRSFAGPGEDVIAEREQAAEDRERGAREDEQENERRRVLDETVVERRPDAD